MEAEPGRALAEVDLPEGAPPGRGLPGRGLPRWVYLAVSGAFVLAVVVLVVALRGGSDGAQIRGGAPQSAKVAPIQSHAVITAPTRALTPGKAQAGATGAAAHAPSKTPASATGAVAGTATKEQQRSPRRATPKNPRASRCRRNGSHATPASSPSAAGEAAVAPGAASDAQIRKELGEEQHGVRRQARTPSNVCSRPWPVASRWAATARFRSPPAYRKRYSGSSPAATRLPTSPISGRRARLLPSPTGTTDPGSVSYALAAGGLVSAPLRCRVTSPTGANLALGTGSPSTPTPATHSWTSTACGSTAGWAQRALRVALAGLPAVLGGVCGAPPARALRAGAGLTRWSRSSRVPRGLGRASNQGLRTTVLSIVVVCGLWREALRANSRSRTFSLRVCFKRAAARELNLMRIVP